MFDDNPTASAIAQYSAASSMHVAERSRITSRGYFMLCTILLSKLMLSSANPTGPW